MAKQFEATSKKRTAPGAATRSFAGRSDIPLVSILTVCRNAEHNIERCIESVLSQDYPRIEYVIQDGNSTDNTLNIISKYGSKIKLESKKDTPNKATYWGLERCTGDIIGMCWTDEELLPGAISWGVEQLLNRPSAGGIFGDVLATDASGQIHPYQKTNTLKWDIKKYLCWEILPNYCSSFFRRSALQNSGFFNYNEEEHCCMYDYYAKVGIHYPIHYVPGFVAKFAMHKNQLSSGSAMLQLMVKLIENSYNTLIQDPNTPSWVHELEPRMKAGIRLAMLPSLVQNAEDYLTAARLIHEAMSYAPDEKFLQRVCPPLMQSLLENEEYDILSTLCDAMESRNLLSDDLGLPKAQTYYKLGRFADAYECIKNTLKHCPFDPAAQMLFVELQHETRRQKQTGLHVETISNGDGAINIFNPGGMDLSQAAASKVRDGEFKR